MADYSINAVTRKVSYSGSAGVGPYAFNFEVLTSSDIAVYQNSTLLTETTNYTVTVNANGTGSVTLVVAATASDTIVIIGARDIERTTDYTAGGALTAASLNTALDAQVIFTQQVSEKADRSLKAPPYDPTTVDMTLPDLDTRKGRLLQFNSVTGNPEVAIGNDDIETLVGISADIATLADIEDGTVATDAISTLATATSQIPTVASNTAAIQAIGNDLNGAAIELDYGDLSAATNPASPTGVLGAIYDNLTTFTTLAPVASDLGTLAGLTTEIGSLGAIDTEITGVYAIRTDVSSVAGIANDVTTVAADATDIGVVATDLSGSDTIGTVAGIAANVTTVAGISANVTTVAGIQSDVTTVAGVTTDLANVTANLSDIQNADDNATAAAQSLSDFQDIYQGAYASEPTAVQTGSIYWNTTLNQLFVWDGSTWNAATLDVSSAVSSFNTRTGAVTLTSADVTTALTYTPADSAALGTAASLDVGTSANKLVQLDGTAKLPAVDGSQLTGISSEGPETTNRGYWTVDTAKTNQFLGKYTSIRVMPSDVTISGSWEALPNAEIYVLESTTLDSFDEYFEEDTTIASGTTHTFYQALNIREGVTITVNGTLEGFGPTPTGSASGSLTLTQVQEEIDGSFVFEAFGESA